MARIPYVNYEEMDGPGREVYDRIRADRNAKEVGFQFRALLHSPQAASHLTSMGAELRFRSAIPENLKELAILVVAREWNSDIEWTAHAVLAEKAGVSPTTIEAIRTGKPLNGLTDGEQVIVRFVQRLLRDKNLPDETFGAAQELLGTRGVVDLTLTCSYYAAINMAQVALKPQMEPGKASTL